MTFTQLRDLFHRAIRRWSDNNATRMAAALAFYAILAFAPLLLFFIAAGSQFLDTGTVHETLLREARTQLGPGAASLVQSMFDSAKKPGESAAAGIVSILLALLGASGLFDQLRSSVNVIWEISPKTGHPIKVYVVSRIASVLMALVFVTMILVWVGIDSVVSFIRFQAGHTLHIWHLVSFILSVAFLTGVFSVAFRTFPRGTVLWRDVWFPAFVTALGFGVSKYLLSLYFGLSRFGSAYGPAGALVVMLLWFYYSSQIFFFGVELTYAYSHGYGSRRNGDDGDGTGEPTPSRSAP
ncbi:MAG: YihY/virulence factor BrkB family protein [Fimbriimonadales bacterium]